MQTVLNDEKLAEMARNGDAEAFDELVRRWERKMYSLCYGIMGNPDDARDAVQEAFSSAYRTIRHFRGDSKFSSWIHRISVNACLTLKRKQKRRSETSLDVPDGSALEPLASACDFDPSLATERRQTAEFVRRAVASLPEEIRVAVVMKEFQEMTFQEISDSLDIPVSTAKSRVYTGFKMLRDKLSSKGLRVKG